MILNSINYWKVWLLTGSDRKSQTPLYPCLRPSPVSDQTSDINRCQYEQCTQFHLDLLHGMFEFMRWMRGLSPRAAPVMRSQGGGHARNTQTKQISNFVLLSEEWKGQCERLMNHCCVEKTRGTKRHTIVSMEAIQGPPITEECPMQDSLIANRGDFIYAYQRLRSYLPGGIFNDLPQWDPCWHFSKTRGCRAGKGKPKQERFFSVFCAFNNCLFGGWGKFPTDAQC